MVCEKFSQQAVGLNWSVWIDGGIISGIAADFPPEAGGMTYEVCLGAGAESPDEVFYSASIPVLLVN